VTAFSVIVATRDRPAALARCLRALARLDQPPGGFEVVVIDDGGRAPLAPALDAVARRLDVALIRRTCPGGPATARNAGAAQARGRVLAFTDDDCRPEPGWLCALARRLANAPGAAAGGRTLSGLPGNRWAAASQAVEDAVYAHVNRDFSDARFFAAKNLAVPAAKFAAVGGFDAAFCISEDRDFCRRWRSSGRRLVYVPDALVHHDNPRDAHAFWRQHVGYGRGAHRYHAVHRRRRRALPRPQPRLYPRLVAGPLAGPGSGPQRAQVAALALAAQAATAAGYALAALDARVPQREREARRATTSSPGGRAFHSESEVSAAEETNAGRTAR
jgi:cellulose synthase/poly-beta-1,6-N-acetylglucosamine synthase-like glycosyltransferase